MRGVSGENGERLARARTALKAAARWVARVYVPLLALLWFGAALATVLWVWGLNPQTFQGDEAVNRMAAARIHDVGRAIVDVPVDDPEDLLHMHEWTSIGRHAVPIYPPVTFYLYGWLLELGVFGQLLIAALPASGVAAFFFGLARLLPPSRRWLALPAPLLGMPAMYWLLRPWANVSLMLTCLCWGFCWWTLWRERRTMRYLAAALFAVGAAASVRPDFAAHLLTAAMLFSLAVAPRSYRAIIGLVLASGLCAVGANLLLNRLVSGTSFRPVYETMLDRDHAVDSAGSLAILLRLWFPIGVPSAAEMLEFIQKYWLSLGQLKWLLAAQLALIPLFFGIGWLARAFYALALLALLFMMISHVGATLFGASETTPLVQHSIPRYWTPLYLFAALPPLLLLGRARFRPAIAVGAVLACLLAWSSLDGIFRTQVTSFPGLREQTRNGSRLLDRLSEQIPPDAIVYSVSRHGTLWTRFKMGLILENDATAASMGRCVRAGLPVYIYSPHFSPRKLAPALAKRRLKIITVDRRMSIFRVERA
jgi:hypothetical protein